VRKELPAAELGCVPEHQLARRHVGVFVTREHRVVLVQRVGESNVGAVRIEGQIVKSLDEVVEFPFSFEIVGVRLEETPVRFVEQEQQRIGKSRQAFPEVVIGA
jgi:hypothetical protein